MKRPSMRTQLSDLKQRLAVKIKEQWDEFIDDDTDLRKIIAQRSKNDLRKYFPKPLPF